MLAALYEYKTARSKLQAVFQAHSAGKKAESVDGSFSD
jgi:hypothetical protein